MTEKYRVSAIIGSTSQPSRTQVLAQAVVAALSEQVDLEVTYVELAKLGRDFGSASSKEGLSEDAQAALKSIERADLIVAASPVYKGSYTGLFKHVIDFIHPDALINRPVILAATGGGDRHALVVEHQLRPLFGFFRAQTIATAVYASEADLQGYQVSSATLQARVDEAAGQALELLRAQGAAAALHELVLA